MSLSHRYQTTKVDLIKAYDDKGMRSSGKWANSLEVIANEDNVDNVGILPSS
jgi:hypothetical protein